MHVCIYYEMFPRNLEDESLKIPYTAEVFYCLVDASTGRKFCWVRIFENHVDVFGRGHYIHEGMKHITQKTYIT